MTPAERRDQIIDEIIARTDLDEAVLDRLVRAFYSRIRADALLGPVFEARIVDWEPHLQRMAAFWSSVALMSGRYHGQPMAKHLPLPVGHEHFARWLALFEATAHEVCSPAGAAHVVERAHRIARSIEMALEDARPACGPPRLAAARSPGTGEAGSCSHSAGRMWQHARASGAHPAEPSPDEDMEQVDDGFQDPARGHCSGNSRTADTRRSAGSRDIMAANADDGDA